MRGMEGWFMMRLVCDGGGGGGGRMNYGEGVDGWCVMRASKGGV